MEEIKSKVKKNKLIIYILCLLLIILCFIPSGEEKTSIVKMFTDALVVHQAFGVAVGFNYLNNILLLLLGAQILIAILYFILTVCNLGGANMFISVFILLCDFAVLHSFNIKFTSITSLYSFTILHALIFIASIFLKKM